MSGAIEEDREEEEEEEEEMIRKSLVRGMKRLNVKEEELKEGSITMSIRRRVNEALEG